MKKITIFKPKYWPRMNVVSVFFLTLFVFADPAKASTEKADEAELAIKGYDPVAYFTMVEAVKGSEAISHVMLDYKWLFTNEEHKAMFIADPMRYMPNYGGYCSYDPVHLGHDHTVDPKAWRIVDDKLYLFYSEATAVHAMPTEKWEKVKAGLAQ
ncbi:MAG: YHS domain-containing (seleno)protein [Arenicellales bacterium]|nr:YHS domain-containing (seleno)protein [Arenicellales bacterium]